MNEMLGIAFFALIALLLSRIKREQNAADAIRLQVLQAKRQAGK